MAKLSRVYQKLFGSAANAGEIGKFGSLAAGSPTTTTDPWVMQQLGNWDGGWFSAVLGGNSPAIEDMNALHYVAFYQLAYLMQEGIPEYDASTTYFIGSVVKYGGQFYKCLVDNTLNVTPAIGANWQYMVDAAYSKADPTGHKIATGTTIQSQLDALDLAMPVGSILPFAGASVTPPAGFLYCDGSSLSTTTYANLYNAIGYTYGGSGGSFLLPNTQGYFLRGAGTTGGYSATVGGVQSDQFGYHDHGGGNHRHQYQTGTGDGDPRDMAADGENFNFRSIFTYYSGTIIAGQGGSETRPANLGVNYIIKF
jgi:microcystin-dependent protein